MMPRVIFLDVDGVLNHLKAFEEQKGCGAEVICPAALEMLRQLVYFSRAKVVLSSTWRKGREPNRLVECLRKHGVLDEAHDDWKTKDWVCKPQRILPPDVQPPSSAEYGCRGDEIAEWLSRHPEVTQYVILDDDGDMLDEQRPFFVQTDFRAGGLTKERAEAAMKIFNSMGPP